MQGQALTFLPEDEVNKNSPHPLDHTAEDAPAVQDGPGADCGLGAEVLDSGLVW